MIQVLAAATSLAAVLLIYHVAGGWGLTATVVALLAHHTWYRNRYGYWMGDEPDPDEWGERYFHLTDPDGHQLSFAKPLASPS